MWRTGFFGFLGVLLLSTEMSQVRAQENFYSGIDIANRYFANRKKRDLRRQTDFLLEARSTPNDRFFENFRKGYRKGEQWVAELTVRRAPEGASSGLDHSLGFVRYTVEDWIGSPEAELRVRIERVSAQANEPFIEERLNFRDGSSAFRRCVSTKTCSTWIPLDSETIRIAGEDTGLGWEYGPVLLPAESIFRARWSSNYWSHDSEDFFGRRFSWKWRQGDPWPERMESAQGFVTLRREGETS
jgi:hypothetical protein